MRLRNKPTLPSQSQRTISDGFAKKEMWKEESVHFRVHIKEWREVRRKKPNQYPANTNDTAAAAFRWWANDPSISSFYVSNLPGGASKKDLWGACSRLGNLVDIYIAGRKDASGKFFAFIRYSDVSDPGAVEDGLCNIICRGRKLVANCAKHPRNIPKLISKRQAIPVPKPFAPAPRDSRSFAEVAGGKAASVEEKKVQLECIKEVSEWTDKSVLVAEAKCYDTLCNFPSLVELEGYDVAEFKYLGGMLTMIKFKTDKAAEIFKANKCIWMKWFNWVDFMGKKLWRFERIAWLKIVGIPLLAWGESNFNLVASNFGKVLVSICPFWNSSDVSFGKVCILTPSRKRLNEEVCISLNGESFKIGVMEIDDDWVPFKPFVREAEDSSDEEMGDEEGVSSTWEDADMELEEGEIDPFVYERSKLRSESEIAQKTPATEVAMHARVQDECRKSSRKSSPCAGATANSNSPSLGDRLEADLPLDSHLPSGHVGPIGSIGPITKSGLFPVDTMSSPEFELGESAAKQRRRKKKSFGGCSNAIQINEVIAPNSKIISSESAVEYCT
ncbi:hypothetical protein LXL04_009118 [Taraxacum kok-saghyz]